MKKLLFAVTVLFVCSLVGGCGSTVVNPCDVQIGAHDAVSPASRANVKWWSPRHEGVLERNAKGNVNLILIGDSITHSWEKSGSEMWQKYYEPRGTVNMGFSGDRTQHVLWRFDNGEIDGIDPKLAVIMIGTNNSNRTDNTSEEIADGIKAIVCKLRTKLPETKVLVLAIFPRGTREQKTAGQGATYNPQWEKNDNASKLASQIADGKMVYYLDINEAFLDDNGTLTKAVMPDLLHPKEKGYGIWAEAMEPMIEKLMR